MGHGCHACGCPNGCECKEIEDQRRSSEILKRLTALIGREAVPLSAVVWPKPRPISEAPKDGERILAWTVREGWVIVRWSCEDWVDTADTWHLPTHFLPLPPEVK